MTPLHHDPPPSFYAIVRHWALTLPPTLSTLFHSPFALASWMMACLLMTATMTMMMTKRGGRGPSTTSMMTRRAQLSEGVQVA